MPAYFITATDTDAGKTYITSMLLYTALTQQYNVMGLKPIASGNDDHAVSDIDLLQAAMQNQTARSEINIYSFKAPIAPHIAAKMENRSIAPLLIKQRVEKYRDKDLLLVEGVGGWLVPINDKLLLPDLVKILNLPIIIIVRIKTGCINHALLTLQAIQQSGLEIKGWIANRHDTDIDHENVMAIERFSGIKCLGKIPSQPSSSMLDLQEKLLKKKIITSEYNDILRRLLEN